MLRNPSRAAILKLIHSHLECHVAQLAFSEPHLMSKSHIANAPLDPRRRRALFRAWHRGMRETDLLMGRFADAEIAGLDETELAEFEDLLEVSDSDIFGWLTGELQVPPAFDTALFRKLKLFHGHVEPLDL
jgi:antitoxin CptB